MLGVIISDKCIPNYRLVIAIMGGAAILRLWYKTMLRTELESRNIFDLYPYFVTFWGTLVTNKVKKVK